MKRELELITTFTTKGILEGENNELIISGVANASEKDRDGDIIVKEAWEQGALDHYVKNPIILAFHDHSRPIGKATEYAVDEGGLHITASISKAAGDVYDLIKEGILRTFSVGFRVRDADYDSDKDLFVIKDLELYEVSVVSVPANAGSTFNVRKSLSDKELREFKKEFGKKEAPKVIPISAIEPEKELKKEAHMPEKIKENSIEALEQKLADMSSGLDLLLDSQVKAEAEKAKADAKAKIEAKAKADAKAKAEAEAEVKASITHVSDGAARLIEDLEKKLEDQESKIGTAVEELRTELKDKSEEILNMQKSRMVFTDNGQNSNKDSIPHKEMDMAVLMSKATGRPIQETKFGKDLLEKYNTPFVPTDPGTHETSMNEDWEASFSTRMFDDIRQRLIIEPLFGNIPMTTASLHMPVNPEAGTAQWIARSQFETPATRIAASPDGSTGAAKTHLMTDITLVAHKLAAKEYIGYEEEEDTILPIMAVIRDAIVRRMARSSDIAILRGDSGVIPTGGQVGELWPFNGLATLADDAGAETVISGTNFATKDAMTVADLGLARQQLGNWGLTPSDVVYVVSPDSYYELLQDADFRTMDMVGTKATILTGQIGMVNGSPVLVSGEFLAAAGDGVAAVAVNTSNFYLGTLRGLMTERDKDIIAQQNVIVTTRRFDFKQIITTEGVSVVLYPSA